MICGSLLSGLGIVVSGKAGYDCELPSHGSDKDCIGNVPHAWLRYRKVVFCSAAVL